MVKGTACLTAHCLTRLSGCAPSGDPRVGARGPQGGCTSRSGTRAVEPIPGRSHPTTVWQELQKMSHTTWRPVVMARSSAWPVQMLATVLKR